MGRVDERLVAALYDGIVDAAALAQAIDAVAQHLGCHTASIVSFDPVMPEVAIALSVGAFDAKANRAYATDFAAHDPAPAAFAAAPSGSVFATDQMFSKDYLRKSIMLHEFLRPLGIEEAIGGSVSARDGRFAILAIHRGADRAAFGNDEISEMEELLPHIKRALQLRRAFAKLETTATLLGGMIDRLTAGVVIMHGDGAVAHVNPAARAVAARGDGLWFDRKGLVHAVDGAAERLLARCRLNVLAGGAGEIVRVPRREHRQPYALLVAPLPAGAELTADVSAQRGVLILIHDPDMRSVDTAQIIASIYQMPQGAAQMVAALIEGEDAKTYAEKRKISYETVRYHLKTAFERTGARSQSRLMQLVTRVLTELRGRQ
jgi:GAF domain-containing protein